jgi:Complex I intermediate-associated protein 30 (CIA30)
MMTTKPISFLRSLVVAGILCSVSALASTKKPWDIVRFVQQSSTFVSLPFVNSKGNNEPRKVQVGDVLWKVPNGNTNDEYSFSMGPLDDVVMGGASSSSFDRNTGIWRGSVTDANNGGFIGIRSFPTLQYNMEKCNGIQWKLRSYQTKAIRLKFVLRDTTDFNGITWTTIANVEPGINTIKIQFNKQVPALFARTVPDQVFRKTSVCAVQMAYSKFEYDGKLNPKFQLGDFSLQLLELRAI